MSGFSPKEGGGAASGGYFSDFLFFFSETSHIVGGGAASGVCFRFYWKQALQWVAARPPAIFLFMNNDPLYRKQALKWVAARPPTVFFSEHVPFSPNNRPSIS